MEFFKIIDKQTSENQIQENVTPQHVANFTETMLFLSGNTSKFKSATLWGEFTISYQKIKGGVRFSLIECPNALSWTITTGYPPKRDGIVLHCTINRTQKPQEFINEVHEFLAEWEQGIMNIF